MFARAGILRRQETIKLIVGGAAVLFLLIILIGCSIEASKMNVSLLHYLSSTVFAGLEKRLWGRKFFGNITSGIAIIFAVVRLLSF